MWEQMSPEAQAWLGERLAVTGNNDDDLYKRLTPAIKAELQALQWTYRSPIDYERVDLYRGTNTPGRHHYNNKYVFGVTYSQEIANNFGVYVYRFTDIEPIDILIDTTIFTDKELFRAGAFPDEREVILLPRSSANGYAVEEVN